MPISLDDDYQASYDSYMADVVRENERRRKLYISRPDPQQAAFSPESEVIRQGTAIERANRLSQKGDTGSETNTNGSGTTKPINLDDESGPINLDAPAPNVSDSRPIPSLRQGSSADAQVKPSMREMRQGDSKPEDWQRLGVKPPDDSPTLDERLSANPAFQATKSGVTSALDTYEENVAGPYRRTMFKEDPLETLAKQAPGPDASPLEIGWHIAKNIGVGLLTDPLTVLGLGAGVAMPRRPTTGLSHPQGSGPSPIAPEPVVPQAPLPSVTDLARQAQEQQLLAAKDPLRPTVSSDLPPTVGKIGDVRQTGTGSLARGPWEHSYTQEEGHTLSTTPTGSMVQLEYTDPKPQPYYGQVEGIPLPSERVLEPPVRSESSVLESRRLHGSDVAAPEYGPPKPPLKSAEDLLAEKLARQAELRKIEQALPKLPDEPPPFDSALLQQPEQAGPRGNALQIPGERSLTQRQPRLWEKVWLQSLDVLDNLGPYTRRMSDILRYSKNYSEQGTRQNYLDVVSLIEKHFGERKWTNRVPAARESATKGEAIQTLLNPSAADWGLTKAENDAVVVLLHARLDSQNVSSVARQTLPISDPRVQALARDYWQVATGRASSLPSVRSMVVRDFLTGESYPVGDVGPYWPHQPINDKTREILSTETMKKMYQYGRYEEKGIGFDLFRDEFTKWWNNKDEMLRLRKFAGFEHKRYLTDKLITDEAERRGISEAEVLRRYGMETDITRMPVRHNYYALKRATMKEFEQEMKDLHTQTRLEYGDSSKIQNWIDTVIDRSQGITKREDFIEHTSNMWDLAQSILYPAFLKGSWKQNIILQPNYAVLQSGLRPTVDAMWRYWGQKLGWSDAKIAEYANRSGATFPAFLTKHHLPEGAAQQYSKTALEWDLFSPSDTGTRKVYGTAGGLHVDKVGREFYANPAEPKWRNYLREYNINPDELYRDMAAQPKEQWVEGGPSVPPKYIMRGMQVGANRSMGRTGIEHMPAWAAGDTEAHHIMLMLRRQIISNESMLVNSIVNAPTAGVGIKRALTFLVGADAAGLMYNGVVNWLMGKDFFDVNKSMKKAFGDNKVAALHAKAILMGMGTFTAGIALTGLQSLGGNPYGGAAYSFMSPAIASVVDEGVNNLLQGKYANTLARLQPSEVVQTGVRRYEDAQRRPGGTGMGVGVPKLP